MFRSLTYSCVLLATAALAQTTAPNDLDYARAQVNLIDRKIKNAVMQGGASPCELERLKTLKRYYQWTVTFADEVASLTESSRNETFSFVKKKMSELSQQSVELAPVKNQSTVGPLTFARMIQHFENVNKRIRNCKANTPGELSVLLSQIEDPELNLIGYSMTQVLDGLKILTQKMNASLKSRDVELELLVDRQEDLFNLSLRVKLNVDGKIIEEVLPIRGAMPDLTRIQTLDRRNAFESKSIGGYSIDGLKRLIQMRNESNNQTCFERKFAPVDWAYQSLLREGQIIYFSKSEKFPVSDQYISLMLSGRCEYFIDDKKSGEIEFKNGVAHFVDWGSSGGTYANDSPTYEKDGVLYLSDSKKNQTGVTLMPAKKTNFDLSFDYQFIDRPDEPFKRTGEKLYCKVSR